MDVELIAIGDEIVSGHTIDTNTPYMARRLANIGLEVAYKTSVGDHLPRLEEAFHQALRRSDLIITSGGLGPTDDDITKRAIVKVFKRNLIFHENVLEDLKRRFADRGIEMPAINQNQALLPQGATHLANRIGSAIGIVIAENQKVFVSLPGVPREMQIILDEELIPYLKSHIKLQNIRVIRLRTTGIFESSLAEKFQPLPKIPDFVHLAYLPSYCGVDLRITAVNDNVEKADQAADAVAAELRKAAGGYIYGEEDDTLEIVIGRLLAQRGERLAVAESCTAGILAAKITDVPGSSEYFDRGVVTYSNQSKTELLGVPEKIIEKHGAVSAEVAEAMATGVRQRSGTDYGVSITGIAGPEGGTEEKPVGTVYIAVASKKGTKSQLLKLTKDREINRHRAAYAALEMLRKTILGIE